VFICRGSKSYTIDAPEGTGPIWLDELYCTRGDQSLVACSHRPIGEHDCEHSDDVGLHCGEELYIGAVVSYKLLQFTLY
jgi:hypothetical protein